MRHPKFRLIAPPFTPMHEDGSLNLAPIGGYAQHLVASGVGGVFVGGTTGEGQSLTLDERIAVADAWAGTAVRSKLELIIHVGHNVQADAARVAAHASSIGADGIAMHAPSWYRRQTAADLVEFAIPVAAAAPKLRFYLYDIPMVTGTTHSAAEFLSLAQPRIPTLAGLKFTNADCVTAQECIQLNNGEFDVLWGIDEMLLIGAALGASGAVGTTYNFAAPLYLKMLDAADAGDWPAARAAQARSVALVRMCVKHSPLAACKFAMSVAGIDCGPARSPVGRLSEDDKRQLRKTLVDGQFITPAS